MKEVNRLYDLYWSWRLQDSPEYATIVLGDHPYADRLDDHSLEAYDRRYKFYREMVENLKSFEEQKNLYPNNNNNSEDALSFKLFKHNIQGCYDGMQYRPYLTPVNNLEGPHTNFIQILSYMPLKTALHYEKYLGRLSLFSVQIDQVIELLKEGVRRSRIPPAITLSSVEAQIENILKEPPTGKPLFLKTFKNFPSHFSSAEIKELLSRAECLLENSIYPAFRKLIDFFKQEYYPKAGEKVGISDNYSDGKRYYAELLKFHTGTSMTAEDIFAIGKDEVDRIRLRMNEVLKVVGFSGPLSGFREYLQNQKHFYFSSEKEMIKEYRNLCKKIEPKLVLLFGTLPRTPYSIKKMTPNISLSAPSAYYYGPSQTGERAGVFWVNTYKLNTRPKYEMVALACHEAVPGHHLQLSLAIERKNLPLWRTNLEDRNYYMAPGREAIHSGYTEGWGLYAEYLGEELKLYKDSYSLFGRLSLEIWRACRLVVDTGMHYFGWTKQQAIDYMMENTALSAFNIEIEVHRYITWPGQACAYKIGELKIRELRKLAEEKLQSKFSVRDFHDVVISVGAVPLTVLDDIVKHWIDIKQKASL